jgi:hypothetical protein
MARNLQTPISFPTSRTLRQFFTTPFTPGAIEKIVVTGVGSGFTDFAAGITITDPTGSGFVGQVINNNGVIANVIIKYGGSGYTAPVVSFTGGSGATAIATARPMTGTYPGLSIVFQQRQIYAASENDPISIFGSRIKEFSNFSPAISLSMMMHLSSHSTPKPLLDPPFARNSRWAACNDAEQYLAVDGWWTEMMHARRQMRLAEPQATPASCAQAAHVGREFAVRGRQRSYCSLTFLSTVFIAHTAARIKASCPRICSALAETLSGGLTSRARSKLCGV